MNTVKVYDFKTKLLSEIPRSELAPFMAASFVEGVGPCWTDMREVKGNPTYQHPPLDANAMGAIEFIRSRLAEVRPLTTKQWEDGFRRDRNYEREIGGCQRCAANGLSVRSGF